MLSLVSADFFTIVCSEMTKLKQLGMMCMTSKRFRDYLYSAAGGRHWTELARRICGERFWPAVDPQEYGANNARYVAMLRVLPYAAKFEQYTITAVAGVHAMGDDCEVTAMQMRGGDVQLRVIVRPNRAVVFSAVKEFAVCLRTRRNQTELDQSVNSLEAVPFPGVPMTGEEEELLRRAKAQFKTPYFDTEEMSRACLVHEGLVAFVFYWDTQEANVLFCATSDLRIVRNMAIETDGLGDGGQCMLFSPGRMWVLSGDGCITYFGAGIGQLPRELFNTGRMDMAFLSVCSGGGVHDAVAQMRALGLGLDTVGSFGPWTLLHQAVIVKDAVAVRALVKDYGVAVDQLSDPDGPDETRIPASCVAAREGDCVMLRLLFDLGANMNIMLNDVDGASECMLQLGVRTGWSQQVLLLLLSLKADANVRASDGTTALFAVAEREGNNLEVVKMLCAAGARVDLIADDAETLFNYWIRLVYSTQYLCNYFSTVCGLGYDVDVRSGPKRLTALMKATQRFDEDVFRVLVFLGADIHAINSDGRTALEMLDDVTEPMANGRFRVSATHNGRVRQRFEMSENHLEKSRKILGAE